MQPLEGPQEPAENQPVRGNGVWAGPGRELNDTGNNQEVSASGGVGRLVKNLVVVLTELPEASTLTGQSDKIVVETCWEEPIIGKTAKVIHVNPCLCLGAGWAS